jgi:hypothetical protein
MGGGCFLAKASQLAYVGFDDDEHEISEKTAE